MRVDVKIKDFEHMARGILKRWEDWQSDAGQSAQQQQDSENYTQKMTVSIRDYLFECLCELA